MRELPGEITFNGRVFEIEGLAVRGGAGGDSICWARADSKLIFEFDQVITKSIRLSTAAPVPRPNVENRCSVSKV